MVPPRREGGMYGTQADSRTLSDDLFCMRGIGIVLVVVIHVLGVDPAHGVRKLFADDLHELRVTQELIHSFNMAVMLMGSGVAASAFGRPESTLASFARKKLRRLLIPMLVWAPILFLMQELSKGTPEGPEGWSELLVRLPGAWFPPYSIFWFVHVLLWCTLLFWLFRRFAAPALGRWSGAVYLVLAIVLHLSVSGWDASSAGGAGDYVAFILYWNRFFGLGVFLQPGLLSVCRRLARLPVALQALLPAGFLGLMVLVYTALPGARYETVCAINGPLGFCMMLSLATFLRTRVRTWGALWKRAWRRLVFAGSISMLLYLFHLYFVSGMRLALEHVFPGTPLAVHLVLGVVAGCSGPWLLLLAFKELRPFRWSTGLSRGSLQPTVRARRAHGAL